LFSHIHSAYTAVTVVAMETVQVVLDPCEAFQTQCLCR